MPPTAENQPKTADQPAADQGAAAQDTAAHDAAAQDTATHDAAVQGAATQAPAAKTRPADVRPLLPALAGGLLVLLLGLGLIFLAWWGARFARRRLGGRLGPSRPLADEWYSKPLGQRPPPVDQGDSEMGS